MMHDDLTTEKRMMNRATPAGARVVVGLILMIGWGCCLAGPLLALDRAWIDDLNQRFPGLGDEYQQAVAHKLAAYPAGTSVDDVIAELTARPAFDAHRITTTAGFGLHSDLMILYPVVGRYDDALQEARLLREVVLANPPDDQAVELTVRGVYAELLIVNERYAEALAECGEAGALAPEHEDLALCEGVAAVHAGELERVLAALGRLLRAPDPENYARQLCDLLLRHRARFQGAQVQTNTMIDMMLRDLESVQERAPITLAAPAADDRATAAVSEDQERPPPPPKDEPADDPLWQLVNASPEQQADILGEPLSETLVDGTRIQEFRYHGQRLTVHRESRTSQIVSCSMLFVPPVSEFEALAHIGLRQRRRSPAVATASVKSWMPYGPFAKVRMALSAGRVLTVVVYP